MFRWTAAGRYIAHLEAEVLWLRSQLHVPAVEPRTEPPPKRAESDQPTDQPPRELVLLCAAFERQGAQLLHDLRERHRRDRISWEKLIVEFRSYCFQQTGDPRWNDREWTPGTPQIGNVDFSRASG